ncbi:magnesium-dependent phosphatase-1 [Neolentinus lepideus HHB14362 ss-1]|uniref:Magnesium-dependent phosphatase-1 n=1 Tax=Neolentinus lepideus HHB14362 ss-1 TaxID=1314782 RepID=A0A165VQL2_9AGAM|nr:magnesium-dependent phosphatase-1 [Neolentinus lepideus HHB14362 ss-1]
MTTRMPKLIAFDLDYTLWALWIDTHCLHAPVSAPLRREGNTLNQVLDRYNNKIEFYREVPQILHRLRAADVTIAACSRTSAPDLARRALQLLLVPPRAGENHGSPTPAIEFFDQMEIYPGRHSSKIAHFKKLHQKTGLPYSEMLFFDDEHRNKEVEALGVTFCLVLHGTDERTLEAGLAEWRKRHPVEVVEDAAGDSGQ